MTFDLSPLERELEAWHRAELTLPIWWRDDDAVDRTLQLDQLISLSDRVGLPVHLAVIPRDARQELADRLPDHMIPVVHGWAHFSHAPKDEKKAEFGPHRSPEAMLNDAHTGIARLRDLFGKALCPIFVPPWNRISHDILPGLGNLGFRAVSTFTPRNTPVAAPDLLQINTHLDPIDWRGSRSLADPAHLVEQLVLQLQDRRYGRADNDEPYGLLTHHLVHDQQIWAFSEAVLERLMAGPVRPWALPSTAALKASARYARHQDEE
ncbi:polysaccharide deacetylase family protein [Primorskyibacter sp. S87]|uniref:polysaccharide deacetylase family protein n=1 Tax=Primorskyibacter sp. S87 TaxID=3415126 RepID=UPI003C7BF25C